MGLLGRAAVLLEGIASNAGSVPQSQGSGRVAPWALEQAAAQEIP